MPADDDIEGHVNEGDLDVRPALSGVGFVKQRRFRQIEMGRRHRPRGGLNQPGQHVVVEVLADARQRRHDGNIEFAQVIGVAEAGQQQQLGRFDRAGANQHLPRRPRALQLTVLAVFDPDAARSLE